MRQHLLLAAVLMLPALVAAADDGFLGFSQQVSVSWLFNVESAIVNYVEPNSPAGLAGIAVNDAITEIEGCAIPGCGAYKAKELMEKAAGESLRLKLKRPDGEEYAVMLTAVKRPESQQKNSSGN